MNNFQKYIIYALLLFPPIVFFTDLTRNPYYFQIFLLNVLILFFWIVHLLRAFKSGSIKWIFSPLDKPLLSFCIFASFTWLYAQFAGQSYHIPEAIEHGKALPGFGMDYLRSSIFSEGSKKFMFTLVNMLMAYWITAVFVPVSFNRQEKEKFLNTTWGLLFFVGFIAAFYGLLQYFEIEFVWGKVLNPFGGRPVSTFGNPNFMSSYLLILFSVAIHYYLSAGTSKVKRFIVLVALVTYFYAIVSTMTRSTWVGLFVAVGIIFAYLVLKGRDILAREIKWLVALALFMAVGFLLWPKSTGGYKTISRITEIGSAATRPYGPVHQRLMIYSSAWDMVRDKPVIGRGWGLFELFYPFYQGKYFFNKIYRQFRTHANNAHNEVLEIWSQTGTIGLGLYLWFLTTMVVYGFKIASGLPEEKKLFPVVVTAGAVGMFVDNFFGNVSIHFCVPAFLYWWNMGVLSQL
ncbi:MAG: O-antigen ligase family protein, partial [Elusimicrobia bacterium]|nr:O-antigen ligase family protein [Elusimicrobiota bacterium]